MFPPLMLHPWCGAKIASTAHGSFVTSQETRASSAVMGISSISLIGFALMGRKRMADELKKRTHKDYTAWDLNVPRYVFIKNRQRLEALFKRKARRKMKQEVRHELDNE